MSKKLYKLYDDQIIWNTLDDAVKAKMKFDCAKCENEISISINSHSEGSLFASDEKSIAKHVQTLSDFYHASARSITTQCQRGHMLTAVFIFGETQPMRYVLVRAASISPRASTQEKTVTILALFGVLVLFVGINYLATHQYLHERTLRQTGIETSAIVVAKTENNIPKSPITYNVQYKYTAGNTEHDANAQVNSHTFNTSQIGKSIPIVVSKTDPSVSRILSNGRYKTILAVLVIVDLIVTGLIIFLFIKHKTRNKQLMAQHL